MLGHATCTWDLWDAGLWLLNAIIYKLILLKGIAGFLEEADALAVVEGG